MTRKGVSIIIIAILLIVLLVITYRPKIFHVRSSMTSTLPGENDYALMKHKLVGLPVSYSINPKNSYGFSENEVVSIIRRAFEEWDDQVPVELFDDNPTIVRGLVTEKNRENLVYFTTAHDVFGRAHFTTAYGSPFCTELTFYIELNQVGPGQGNFPPVFRDNEDFFDTILHEVGHVLGLDHPDRTGTVMSQVAENLLAPGDILGVKALYGEKTRVYIASDNWSTKVSPSFSTPISARTWLENNRVDYVMIENFEWPLVTESNWMFELSSGEVQYKSA